MSSQHKPCIGIVGTGFGQYVQLPVFQAFPNVTVIGVASADPVKARDVARRHNLPCSYASWRELVQDPRIDMVSIVTPPSLHHTITLAAVNAGKAVLCEKPFGLDAAEAREMLSCANARGIVHAVDFEFREIPALRHLKSLLEEGHAGALKHVRISWIVSSWHDPTRPWGWQTSRVLGGGTLSALGSHVFNYVEWLFGPARHVTAHVLTVNQVRYDRHGVEHPVDADEVDHVFLELESGVQVDICLSMVAASGTGHCIEVFGDQKTLLVRNKPGDAYGDGFNVLESSSDGSVFTEVPLPSYLCSGFQFTDRRKDLFSRLAAKLCATLAGGDSLAFPSFNEGYRCRLLIDAAYRSSLEKRCIPVRSGLLEHEHRN